MSLITPEDNMVGLIGYSSNTWTLCLFIRRGLWHLLGFSEKASVEEDKVLLFKSIDLGPIASITWTKEIPILKDKKMREKDVTNTNDQWRNPLMLLDMGIFGGTGKGIEAQEARGQQELVDSTQLPTEVQNKEAWEALGFEFGEPCPDDPLFCYAKLPEGWTKKATNHSMHSDILDEKGRRRGGIFYKAAFYDRKASMNPPICRYISSPHYFYDDSSVDDNTVVEWEVVDRSHQIDEDDKIIFSSRKDGLNRDEDRDTYFAASDKCADEVREFLNNKYPDHKNPLAYWD